MALVLSAITPQILRIYGEDKISITGKLGVMAPQAILTSSIWGSVFISAVRAVY